MVNTGQGMGSAGGSSQPRSSAVVGLQWGDEGKGKAVDLLAAGTVDVLSLVTSRLKFAEAVEAMKRARQPEQIKVVMEV